MGLKKIVRERLLEATSYLNLHGDDDYEITQVVPDNTHKYKRVDGVLYELSGNDKIVGIGQVEPTEENMFYEDQIKRYMEYIENGGVIQTFPVLVSRKCYNLVCMLEYLDDVENFDEMYDLLKDHYPKLYDVGLSNVIIYLENFGFPEDLDKYIDENYDDKIYLGLEAIIEYFEDEEEYTLTDFNHRFEALKRLGKKEVMVDDG